MASENFEWYITYNKFNSIQKFDSSNLMQFASKYLYWLILGKNPEYKSPGDLRRALLIGEVSFLILISNIIYVYLDLITESSLGIISLYLLVILITFAVFIFNRKGRTRVARHILMYTILIAIYIFGSNNIQNTQTYLLYIPLVLFSFTVNGYKDRWKSILFSIFALSFFVLDYFTEFSIFTKNNVNDDVLNLMITTNFSITFLSTVYISYFLTKTYYLSEKDLLARQKKLSELTDDLRNSQQRYELSITGTNAGLWDWDLKKDLIYHAPKWNEMLGIEKDKFNNSSIDQIYKLIHPDELDYVKKAISDHLENKVPYQLEYRIQKNDGIYEWFLDSGKAIYDESNIPVRMVGSIINVTERKQAEEKILNQKDLLEKANSELDRFVYITSHDLKAPLLSIQGLINLAEISEDETEIEMCLKMMKDRIKGLESFIADIIDYSRNVRTELIRENIPLKNLVLDIINEFQFLENVDKLEYKLEINDKFSLFSDKKRIRSILKNLIFNAVKYQNYDQTNPFIQIDAYNKGDEIIISVKDNGDGIDERIQNNIFDMFFRASEKSSGSGLGLYIVKEMVNRLDGSISVISKPEIGSEFIISIPVLE